MTRPQHTLFGVITLGTICCLLYIGGWVLFIHIITSILPH